VDGKFSGTPQFIMIFPVFFLEIVLVF